MPEKSAQHLRNLRDEIAEVKAEVDAAIAARDELAGADAHARLISLEIRARRAEK